MCNKCSVWLGLLAVIGNAAAQDFPDAAALKRQAQTRPASIEAMQIVRPATAGAASAPLLVDQPKLPAAKIAGPINLLGQNIPAGSKVRLNLTVAAGMEPAGINTPITVINGKLPGPVLCLTAGIHGDELNGIEVVNRMIRRVEPASLRGVLIGVPVINVSGFQRSSRYLPDRRDLNRYFPGNATGSAASRLAYQVFHSVIVGCDMLVDFHTGSFERANLPQVRGDLRINEVLSFTRNFGATTVLHSAGSPGMLRVAATNAGIPAVTFELGAPIRLEQKEIEFGTRAIDTLMSKLQMSNRLRVWNQPQPVLYRSQWLRANVGGLLISSVELGAQVQVGQMLATIRNPLNGGEAKVLSQARGKIIGLALNQQVMPGYALFHIGVESTERDVVMSALKPRLLARGDVTDAEEDDAEAETDVSAPRGDE